MHDSVNRTITIVIPVKNEENYIARCLQAVLNQEHESFNVIVVDNGSTDNTVKIVKEFHDVTLLEKKDGTIASVRNYGASQSRSDFIAFLDGDCVPPSQWIKTGLALLIEKEASCVGFTASAPNASENWVSRTWHILSSSSTHDSSCYVNWLSSFNLIVKRNCFEEINGFDESLETCEDYDLGRRLSGSSKLWFSRELSIQHLGTVNSLKQFFLKELWRGKSSLKQAKTTSSGFKSILGIIIPIFYSIISVLILIGSVFFPFLFTYFLLFLLFLPSLYALRRLKKLSHLKKYPLMVLLSFVYLFARGIAILRK